MSRNWRNCENNIISSRKNQNKTDDQPFSYFLYYKHLLIIYILL